MEILCGNELLSDPGVLEALAPSIWDPTPERLAARAADYLRDPHITVFAAREEDRWTGAAVVRSQDGQTELLSIAVKKEARGAGVGRGLVSYLLRQLSPGLLLAETDNDAVGFYRALGFQVESLGEKYPGTVRYRCTLPGKMAAL